MSDLISRLESGEGLDRGLDELIWAISEPGHKITRASTPKYTESLDAAVALVEKMLPDDYGFQIGRSSYMPEIGDKGPRHYAEIWDVRSGLRIRLEKHNDKARALLIALLRALSTATRNPEKE